MPQPPTLLKAFSRTDWLGAVTCIENELPEKVLFRMKAPAAAALNPSLPVVMVNPATVEPAPGETLPEILVSGDAPRLGSSPISVTPAGTFKGKTSPFGPSYVPGLTNTVWPLCAKESALVM